MKTNEEMAKELIEEVKSVVSNKKYSKLFDSKDEFGFNCYSNFLLSVSENQKSDETTPFNTTIKSQRKVSFSIEQRLGDGCSRLSTWDINKVVDVVNYEIVK